MPTRQIRDDTKPKHNPKLVCHICGYTGHAAEDCRKQIPEQISTLYGHLPFKRTDDQENMERRRELKQQQKPLNQLEVQDDDNDLSSERGQDFQ